MRDVSNAIAACRRALVLASTLTLAAPAVAQVPLADVLEILVLDRRLVAIDAAGGGRTTERLRLDERVHWKGARGRVGVALTDERILAVTTRSAAWQESRYRKFESRPERAVLGDRVALVVTDQRAVGFDGGSGNLVETALGPGESVLELAAGDNVAVVVTDRRALGLSPLAGGFFQTRLDLSERIEEVSVLANLATIVTQRRVLIFRAPSGSWEESRRDLRPD